MQLKYSTGRRGISNNKKQLLLCRCLWVLAQEFLKFPENKKRNGSDFMKRYSKKLISVMAMAVLLVSAVCGCGQGESEIVPTPYDEYNLEEYIRVADYSGFTYELPEITVSDEEIEQRVNVLLKEAVTYDEIRSGAVSDGDKIHISYTADCEGQRVFTNEGYAVTMGKGYLSEELENALLGQEVGTAVQTSTIIPEDFTANPTLAGKEVVYNILIEFIYDEHIPAFNEEFVKNTSEFETIAEYEENVRKIISEEKMEDALQDAFQEAWTGIVDQSETLGYPEAALDTERFYFYSSYGSQLPSDITSEELDSLCDEYAKESVKQKMVLYSIAKAENLLPTVKEYKAELESYLAEMDFTPESFEATYSMTIYDYAISNEWIGDYLYGEVAALLMGTTL